MSSSLNLETISFWKLLSNTAKAQPAATGFSCTVPADVQWHFLSLFTARRSWINSDVVCWAQPPPQHGVQETSSPSTHSNPHRSAANTGKNQNFRLPCCSTGSLGGVIDEIKKGNIILHDLIGLGGLHSQGTTTILSIKIPFACNFNVLQAQHQQVLSNSWLWCELSSFGKQHLLKETWSHERTNSWKCVGEVALPGYSWKIRENQEATSTHWCVTPKGRAGSSKWHGQSKTRIFCLVNAGGGNWKK